jgi:hypothetical protein
VVVEEGKAVEVDKEIVKLARYLSRVQKLAGKSFVNLQPAA